MLAHPDEQKLAAVARNLYTWRRRKWQMMKQQAPVWEPSGALDHKKPSAWVALLRACEAREINTLQVITEAFQQSVAKGRPEAPDVRQLLSFAGDVADLEAKYSKITSAFVHSALASLKHSTAEAEMLYGDQATLETIRDTAAQRMADPVLALALMRKPNEAYWDIATVAFLTAPKIYLKLIPDYVLAPLRALPRFCSGR